MDVLLRDHRALGQRPAEILLLDATAAAAVDEQLHLPLQLLERLLAVTRPRRVLKPLLGRLPLADRRLDDPLDRLQVPLLFARREGDRPPGPADAAGAADPVNVDLGVVG